MKKAILALAAATMVLSAPAALEAKPRLTPQEQLDKMLSGRVAGKPVSCISLTSAHDTTIIDGIGIVYADGNTLYVNKPKHPGHLDDDDILVTETHGSQLCRLDIVKLHDRGSQMFSGFVSLEDFVPYRKVRG